MDEIVLTLPRERSFHGVAHLVLGGLAARINLTFEHLEDLQLALDSLLARHDPGDVTIRLRLADGSIETQVGPFETSLRAELEHDAGAEVDLRRILEAVADGVEATEDEGGTWVTLRKDLNGAAGERLGG